MKYTEQIIFMSTQSARADLEATAEKYGLTLSAFIRFALADWIRNH